jgi:hypothetical protein
MLFQLPGYYHSPIYVDGICHELQQQACNNKRWLFEFLFQYMRRSTPLTNKRQAPPQIEQASLSPAQLSAAIAHCRSVYGRLGTDRAHLDKAVCLRALIGLRFTNTSKGNQRKIYRRSNGGPRPGAQFLGQLSAPHQPRQTGPLGFVRASVLATGNNAAANRLRPRHGSAPNLSESCNSPVTNRSMSRNNSAVNPVTSRNISATNMSEPHNSGDVNPRVDRVVVTDTRLVISSEGIDEVNPPFAVSSLALSPSASIDVALPFAAMAPNALSYRTTGASAGMTIENLLGARNDRRHPHHLKRALNVEELERATGPEDMDNEIHRLNERTETSKRQRHGKEKGK